MARQAKDYKRLNIKMGSLEYRMMEVLCAVERTTKTDLIESLMISRYIDESRSVLRWAKARDKDLATLPLFSELDAELRDSHGDELFHDLEENLKAVLRQQKRWI